MSLLLPRLGLGLACRPCAWRRTHTPARLLGQPPKRPSPSASACGQGRRGFLCAAHARAPSSSSSSSRVALVDEHGAHRYADLAVRSDALAGLIRQRLNDQSTGVGRQQRHRVSFLCGNNADFVVTQWAIWKAGHAAVPLCPAHPTEMLDYYVRDSKSSLVVAAEKLAEQVSPITNSDNLLTIRDEAAENHPPSPAAFAQDGSGYGSGSGDPALIIYTSGSTGPPKGVVLTHANLQAQIQGMVKAWQWKESDCLLHVLPLNHVHGLVNCLLCPLSVGAKVVMLPRFDARRVWNVLLRARNDADADADADHMCRDDVNVNVFMAVPTVYAKLVAEHAKMFAGDKGKEEQVKRTLRENIRLMVCGSAALPEPVLKSWRDLTGHTLLERYGMTEIGMALSNSIEEDQRQAGTVGKPMPGVEVKIVRNEKLIAKASDSDFEIDPTAATSSDLSGDLYVRGPNVFREYFGRPDATRDEFSEGEGWFRTGDNAAVDEKGVFKILGRNSVDILKSGGHKISALDVERVLLGHPAIKDVAVVGVEDKVWGQKVAAVIVMGSSSQKELNLEQLRSWSENKMASYMMPTKLKILAELPRNNMGKVNKKTLVKMAFGDVE